MYKYKEEYLLGQSMVLLPDRAIFWKDEKLLIVADPHFGKAQIFRDSGIPIPEGSTAEDLTRLSCLMDHFLPRKLLFLGDLIHGRIANPADFKRLIDQWRQHHMNVELLLSTGNHDLRCGDPPDQFRFDHVAAEIIIGSFIFTHKPRFDSSFYGIAGHLHPAVTISGKGRLKETLPCFCFGARASLLPAFGSFTGNQVIRPAPDDRIFVIAGDEVIKMQKGAVHGTQI
jgi:DNA ligase-associated metallophosphoesterase